jgi:RNA polymerase sigma-70 factor, ECF subfamily
MTALENLSDGDLARRIAAAVDAPAQPEEGELCRRYARRLVAFGRRHLGTGDAGRDLAQDALLTTLAKLRAGEVREPDKVGAFLLGVARTLALSSRRRGARLVPLDAAGRELVAASLSPPDPLARDKVRACLEALPERQRSILVLTFYAEQTSADIAASLGLSAENVRVIRHRGVHRLRDCLGLAEPAA